MKYALLMMLLIGLLVPMTIASSSIDFDLNTVLFDDQEIAITVGVLKSVHPLKIKFMITKEVAEGVQKRRLIGSKKVNHITLLPDIYGYSPMLVEGRPVIQIQARCKVESVNRLDVDILDGTQSIPNIYDKMGFNSVKDTNYIRYL